MKKIIALLLLSGIIAGCGGNKAETLVLPPNKKVLTVSSTYGRPTMALCRNMRNEEVAEEYTLITVDGSVLLVIKEVKQ